MKKLIIDGLVKLFSAYYLQEHLHSFRQAQANEQRGENPR